jgi:2-dehydropantoate 2-reductase
MAARLAGSRHEVEVTARGAHLESIRENGIRLRGGWGFYDARVLASEILSLTPDLAIVATKAQDAEAAITANLDHLQGIPVLVVQNGVEGLDRARALLPDSEVVGGLAMFAASFLTAGEVTITAPGPTFVGGGPAATSVVATLNPSFDALVVDNFEGAQWTKLVVNMVNALPAITGLSVQETISLTPLRKILVASMRETVRVGFAAGVTFASLSGLTDSRLRLLARAPFVVAQSIPLLMAQRMGPVPNPGSTLQSIRRGQRSEIDYLNGAVVAAARRVDVPTPVNSALVRLVHEVEARGSFFSTDEVVASVARQ